jgi:hypothetical protein
MRLVSWFMNRVPAMPDFFYKICNDRCVADYRYTPINHRCTHLIISGHQVTKAVYYLRVLTMLSDKDINDDGDAY